MDVAVFHKVCFQKQSMYPIWSMDHNCIQGYYLGMFLNIHTHTHTICTILKWLFSDFSVSRLFSSVIMPKKLSLPRKYWLSKTVSSELEPIDILPQVFSYLDLDETDKCRILESHALYLRTGRQRPLYNLLMAEITPANPGGRSDHSGMSFKSLWGRKNRHVKVMRVSTRHRVSQKEINH